MLPLKKWKCRKLNFGNVTPRIAGADHLQYKITALAAASSSELLCFQGFSRCKIQDWQHVKLLFSGIMIFMDFSARIENAALCTNIPDKTELLVSSNSKINRGSDFCRIVCCFCFFFPVISLFYSNSLVETWYRLPVPGTNLRISMLMLLFCNNEALKREFDNQTNLLIDGMRHW